MAALRSGPELPRRAAGFSLLEAIVALAILAIAGLALFTLIIESQRSVQRASDAFQESVAAEQAELWLRGVNPAIQPEGSATLGSTTINWRSRPETDPTDNLNFGQGVGSFRIALYRIEAEVRQGNGSPLRFELLQAGWQQVRPTQSSAFGPSGPAKSSPAP